MLYEKRIKSSGSYDLVVCGGGMSGFAAAYAAAREGLRVLVIERSGCLGGVGTDGLVNDILGQRHYVGGKLKASVGGIFDILEKRLLEGGHAVDARLTDPEHNPHGWYASLASGLIYENEYMKALLEEMLCEVGAKVLYYTDCVDVVTEDDRVNAVVIFNKDGLSYVEGKCFADTTGDGDICSFAEVPSEKGDDDGGLAAASLEMHVEGVDGDTLAEYMYRTRDLRFRDIISRLRSEGKWQFPYDIFISVRLCRDDVFFINTIRQVGIDGTNAASLTKGVIDGRRESLELLDIMRKYFPGFADCRLRQIAPKLGIRETRRIECDYRLTVNDLIEGRVFEDSIAVSSYGWDLPHPKQPSLQPSSGVKRRSPYTHIPYRCMLPTGVDNLIIAGRSVCCEREALGPVRVMGPCLAMGEAAGIAASLALYADGSFRSVDIPTLLKRIKAHGGITHME